MLKVKSKYKIAKRLGASIFEKTQSQKFALSQARSAKTRGRGRRGPSDYGKQLLEKQKLRYTYGLGEKQLSKYAADASRTERPAETLFQSLELRADNAVYRAGFAPTRRAARQMVSHGHVTVNGRRITTPSLRLRTGDVLGVREGSRSSALFAHFGDAEKMASLPSAPAWISLDSSLMQARVESDPTYSPADGAVDLPTVFEFYSR